MKPVIALVAHEIHNRGGMERVMFEQILRLSEDVEFIVISAGLALELRPLVQWRRIRVPLRPFPLRFVAFFVLAGIRLWREGGLTTQTCGAIVPNKVQIVTVHHCHAGVKDQVSSKGFESPIRRVNSRLCHRLALAAERWTYRPTRATVLAAVSEPIEAELRRYYPAMPTASTPNGVDTDYFRPDPDLRESVRQSHGLGPEDVVALMVGGDWDRKGLDIAIEALSHCRKTSVQVQFWVVGRGDAKRYAGLADRFGVGDKVRFFGTPSEVRTYYLAADLFVLPTQYEGFSLVALEASAIGLPLITTGVGITRVLVGDEDAGILVDRDPRAVGHAISRLAGDAELRCRMGAEGRRRSLAYSWEVSARALKNIYSEMPNRT